MYRNYMQRRSCPCNCSNNCCNNKDEDIIEDTCECVQNVVDTSDSCDCGFDEEAK